MDILAIMCWYKKVHTRSPRNKWGTAEIYSLIRERKIISKNFRKPKHPELLCELRTARHRLNATIDKAMENYVKNLLTSSEKDPKRFWRNIRSVTENENANSVNISFKDPDIPNDESSNFVNEIFASISDRGCKNEDSFPYIPGKNVGTIFYFIPEIYEIVLFAEDIDICSSSDITGINLMICKVTLLHIPDKN